MAEPTDEMKQLLHWPLDWIDVGARNDKMHVCVQGGISACDEAQIEETFYVDVFYVGSDKFQAKLTEEFGMELPDVWCERCLELFQRYGRAFPLGS